AHTGSRHSRQRARSVALAIARRNLAAVPSPAPRARDDSPTELPGRLGGFGHAGRKHRANSRPVPRPSQEAARSPRRNESAAHGRGCVIAEPAFEPLLAELRNVVDQADPIPEPVVAAAKAVFTWRTIDAELAELVADSFVTAAGTRTADAARLLTFQADDTEVEVEIAATGATRRITGQLVPPGPAEITIRWAGGSVEARTDELGRFSADNVPALAVSLSILRRGAGRPVVTSWVSI